MRVQLDGVAGGDLEAHAFAGFQHLAGGDALGLHAVGLQLAIEVVQRGLIQHLEAEEVEPGAVGLAQHDAVVVALGAGLEVRPALGVATHGLQAHDLGVPLDRFFEIEHANLGVPRTQDASHCHESSPCGFQVGGTGAGSPVRQTFFFIAPITLTRRSLVGLMRHDSTQPAASSATLTCSRLITRRL